MDLSNPADLDVVDGFHNLRRLTDHWARPASPPSYYWYLTFENATEVHAVARRCQQAISFPYYDLTPPDALHLTLDRVAFRDDVTPDALRAVEAAAAHACQRIPAFDIALGALGGRPSAVGFTAFPPGPLQDLVDALRAATRAVYPDAPVRRSAFHPHVAIAYANSDGVRAAPVVQAVERMGATARADVTVQDVALVLLERRQRSYAWDVVSRIPLSGGEERAPVLRRD